MCVKEKLVEIEAKYYSLSHEDCHVNTGDDVSEQRRKDILFGKVLGYDEVMVILKRESSQSKCNKLLTQDFAVLGRVVRELMYQKPNVKFCSEHFDEGERVVIPDQIQDDHYYYLKARELHVIEISEMTLVNTLEALNKWF